ncbi:MAG: DUF2997 domain-containing protein [Treponema sp.]|jgi:hypothetical protein|nr:DUF2997 domain-containing protein [Treponema sp.]
MAEKQELEIEISSDGNVTVNVHGAKGSSCRDLTKELEESIGFVTEREHKSSFYEADKDTNIQIQGGEK